MLLSFLFFFFFNYLILAVLDLVPVWVFPWLQSVGAHSSCAARSSHCHGFSCWGAQALGSTSLSSCDTGLVAPRHVGVFLDKGSNRSRLHFQAGSLRLSCGGSLLLSFQGCFLCDACLGCCCSQRDGPRFGLGIRITDSSSWVSCFIDIHYP